MLRKFTEDADIRVEARGRAVKRESQHSLQCKNTVFFDDAKERPTKDRQRGGAEAELNLPFLFNSTNAAENRHVNVVSARKYSAVRSANPWRICCV